MNGLRCSWNRGGNRLHERLRAERFQNWRPSLFHTALKVYWLHSHEAKRAASRKQPGGTRALRKTRMFLQDAPQPRAFRRFDFFQQYEISVQHVFCFRAKDLRKSSGHAGAKIQSERAKHEHDAAGHILATVLPDAFHHRERAAIANGKSFPGPPRYEKPPGRCAIQNRIANEHVTSARRAWPRGNRNCAAGESLADVVVRLAAQFQRHAVGEKRAETLPRSTDKFMNGIFFRNPFGCD